MTNFRQLNFKSRSTKKYRKKRKFFRDSIFFKKYDLYLHPLQVKQKR